jgi:hypothetical protein
MMMMTVTMINDVDCDDGCDCDDNEVLCRRIIKTMITIYLLYAFMCS